MSKKVRVCQFTPCLWSGGTEERIARVLAAMPREEFEITWMGFGPVREAMVDKAGEHVQIIPIARNPAGGIEPAIIARITQRLSRIRPHVMHVHNWSTSLYGIAAARLAGVPSVLYGSGGREVSEGAGARRRQAMRALAPHIDRFTAVCEFLGFELADNFGVRRDRVAVLRTGVDIDRIDGALSRRAARKSLGIPEDAIVVGAISVFRPVKRIPDLIDAVGALAKSQENLHLLLVGNPVRMTVEELRARATDAGLGDRIHLPGRLEDPGAVLNAFDVVVNCSIFEGSSNAIIEAMAAGIPVVGTAVGGTPELVADGVNGLLVPPEDVPALQAAIGRLVSDVRLRATMGSEGRSRALERHTRAAMVGAYLDLYRESAATGSRWPRLTSAGRSLTSFRQLIDDAHRHG